MNTYVPIFRGLDARGGRKLRTDTHTHTHTHCTHTWDNYSNRRCAHARRGLIKFLSVLLLLSHCSDPFPLSLPSLFLGGKGSEGLRLPHSFPHLIFITTLITTHHLTPSLPLHLTPALFCLCLFHNGAHLGQFLLRPTMQLMLK